MNEVCPTHTERFKLRAVNSSLDPLMHGLASYRRIDEPPRFLHTVIIAHRIVAGPPFRTRAANAKACQRISEVHDCQLYHTGFPSAIGYPRISALRFDIRQALHYPVRIRHESRITVPHISSTADNEHPEIATRQNRRRHLARANPRYRPSLLPTGITGNV